MTAIKGYAGMIEGFELPRERLLDCSRQILDECDRMTAMIEEILEFTRGGRTPMSPARVPIVELCSRLRQHMAHDFEERGARFEEELAYGGPVVLDLDRMTRALVNIASNALDAMGRGGVFTFASRLTGPAVELVLSDTGPGVPASLAGRVFEPFFSSGKPRGVGLGMSIARRIVEEHGGLIRLTTSAPEGARFVVSLPLDPATSSR
jgi:signal transduction histidine kinase